MGCTSIEDEGRHQAQHDGTGDAEPQRNLGPQAQGYGRRSGRAEQGGQRQRLPADLSKQRIDSTYSAADLPWKPGNLGHDPCVKVDFPAGDVPDRPGASCAVAEGREHQPASSLH